MSKAPIFRIALPLMFVIPCAMAAQVPAALANAIGTRDRAEMLLDPVTWNRLTADDFTIVLADGVAYLQAGAGIVADSDPTEEHEECLRKLAALETAIDMAEEGL